MDVWNSLKINVKGVIMDSLLVKEFVREIKLFSKIHVLVKLNVLVNKN